MSKSTAAFFALGLASLASAAPLSRVAVASPAERPVNRAVSGAPHPSLIEEARSLKISKENAAASAHPPTVIDAEMSRLFVGSVARRDSIREILVPDASLSNQILENANPVQKNSESQDDTEQESSGQSEQQAEKPKVEIDLSNSDMAILDGDNDVLQQELIETEELLSNDHMPGHMGNTGEMVVNQGVVNANAPQPMAQDMMDPNMGLDPGMAASMGTDPAMGMDPGMAANMGMGQSVSTNNENESDNDNDDDDDNDSMIFQKNAQSAQHHVPSHNPEGEAVAQANVNDNSEYGQAASQNSGSQDMNESSANQAGEIQSVDYDSGYGPKAQTNDNTDQESTAEGAGMQDQQSEYGPKPSENAGYQSGAQAQNESGQDMAQGSEHASHVHEAQQQGNQQAQGQADMANGSNGYGSGATDSGYQQTQEQAGAEDSSDYGNGAIENQAQ